MASTNTDQMLLEFALREIHNFRAMIFREPQHWIRKECISFPIEVPMDCESKEQEVRITMAGAAIAAQFWLEEVIAGRATLDRQRLFY
jgi:hypothetical protein